MTPVPTEMTPERRALMARKGQILYGKFCGTKGRGICAESFALYQLKQGHVEVVTDLLEYLDGQLLLLREADRDGLLAMTEGLVARLRKHLDTEG